jgi:hypothetical protein
MRRQTAAAFLMLVAMLIAAPVAAAHGHPTYLAPPGNSGVSQYLEVVPSAGGPAQPRPPGGSGGGAPGESGGGLTKAQRRSIESLGTAGTTLATVVVATSPPPPTSGSGSTSGSDLKVAPPQIGPVDSSRGHSSPSGSGPASGPAATPPGANSGSAVSAVLSAATGHEVGGGLGWLLPLLLAGGIFLAAAAIWRRTRRS